jgi:ribosomal protein L14
MAYFITADCPARMPKSSQYMSHVNIVKISRGICRKDGEKIVFSDAACDGVARCGKLSWLPICHAKKSARRGRL